MLPAATAATSPSGPATAPLSEILSSVRPMNNSPGCNGRPLAPAVSDAASSIGESTRLRFHSADDDSARVVFYSHDTMGLGHLRRNLILAQTLSEAPLAATSLLVAGAHEANFFALPPRVGLLTLPRLHKDGAGNYASGHLRLPLERLVKLRASSIRSALDAFAPNLLVVDKVPAGAFGEMLPALKRLRRRHGTKCVLGLRDVLDEPEQVRREWENGATQDALRKLYDQIWVYGDRRVYDVALEYHWPTEIAEKVRYTGYLDQTRRLQDAAAAAKLPLAESRVPADELVVCSLGGGQDGYELAHAFIDGLPERGYHGVLITGPFMPADLLERLHRRIVERKNLQLIRFTPESDRLIQMADQVITMGGYNSICSVLSFGKRALVSPRVVPRKEQLIRAERLEQLGLIDVLRPGGCWVAEIARWIVGQRPARRPPMADVIALDGLASVDRYASRLIGERHGVRPRIIAPKGASLP